MSAASSSSKDDGDADCCAVCLGDVKAPYKLMRCKHVFCKDCLSQVKKQMRNDPRCPMCRTISFSAKLVLTGDVIDFGHPDDKRMAELKISREDIEAAMGCVNCSAPSGPDAPAVQCDTCHRKWHTTCTIEIVLELEDEDGKPLRWSCPRCAAMKSVNDSKAARAEMFAEAARARRRQAEESGVKPINSKFMKGKTAARAGGGKYNNSKRKKATDDGEDDVTFSGRFLKKSRAFGGAAAVPRSPGSEDAEDDHDDDVIVDEGDASS